MKKYLFPLIVFLAFTVFLPNNTIAQTAPVLYSANPVYGIPGDLITFRAEGFNSSNASLNTVVFGGIASSSLAIFDGLFLRANVPSFSPGWHNVTGKTFVNNRWVESNPIRFYVSATPPPTPTISFTINGTTSLSVAPSSSLAASWSSNSLKCHSYSRPQLNNWYYQFLPYTGSATITAPSQIGTYRFDLTCWSNWGNASTATSTVVVDVVGGNLPPTISLVSGPNTLAVNQSGSWKVAGTDPEGGPVSYSVNWNDGTTSGPTTATIISHSYPVAKLYVPTFTATDNSGLSASVSTNVQVGVTSGTPVITSISPSSASAGTVVTLNGSNFAPNALVLMNGLVTPTTNTTSRITFVVPANTPIDSYGVSVLNPSINANSNTVYLSVTNAPVASTTLNVSLAANSPKKTAVVATAGVNENELDKLTILAFNLAAGNADVTIKDLTFQVSKSGNATFPTYYLYDGNTEIDNASPVGNTVTFLNTDFNIDKYTRKTLWIKVDVRNANVLPSTISAAIAPANVRAVNTSGQPIISSGTTAQGATFEIRNIGAELVLLAKSMTVTGTNNSGSTLSTSTITGTFDVAATAKGGDIIMGQAGSTSPSFIFDIFNSAGVIQVSTSTVHIASSGIQVTSISTPMPDGTEQDWTNKTFTIRKNETANMRVTVSFAGKNTAGQVLTDTYAIGIGGVTYLANGQRTTLTFMKCQGAWITDFVRGFAAQPANDVCLYTPSLTSPTTNPVAPTPRVIYSPTACYYIGSTFGVGAEGPDVITLQKFLASRGLMPSQYVTGSFKNLTKSALSNFQRRNGILPAEGYFGLKTQALVNSFCNAAAPAPIVTPYVSPKPTATPVPTVKPSPSVVVTPTPTYSPTPIEYTVTETPYVTPQPTYYSTPAPTSSAYPQTTSNPEPSATYVPTNSPSASVSGTSAVAAALVSFGNFLDSIFSK